MDHSNYYENIHRYVNEMLGYYRWQPPLLSPQFHQQWLNLLPAQYTEHKTIL